MNKKKDGMWLRQTGHIRGRLWDEYFVTINQVITTTVKCSKWCFQPLFQKFLWEQQPFLKDIMIGTTSSVLFQYTDSDCPFGMFKLFLDIFILYNFFIFRYKFYTKKFF